MINLRKDAENQVLDDQFKESCRDHWEGAHPCPYKHNPDGTIKTILALSRIDTKNEIEYYKNDGILKFVLRKMI